MAGYNMVLMSDWSRRLLGISQDVANKFDVHSIGFAAGWTMRALAIFLIAAALWHGIIYLKDGKRPSLWIKAPLLVLRMIALCALIGMLFQPMLRMQRSDKVRPSVILLVDNSLSMGFKDPRLSGVRADQVRRATGGDPYNMTRLEAVKRTVNNSGVNMVAELTKKYNLRLYRFASEPQPVPLPVDAKKLKNYHINLTVDERRGNSTQMGSALRRALDDVSGQPVAGALVMTDGGNNMGDDPVTIAERGKSQGIRISSLGIGDPTPTRDIALAEVLADQVVRKDGQVQVFASVTHRGYEGKTVTLTLRRGGETIGVQSVRLGAAQRKQTVTFTYVPKDVGSFTYTVNVSALSGEITSENNRRNFLQKVTSKKLKILYVEGDPRWEYRYLKNAILRDKEIIFSCLLTAPDSPKGGEGNVPIYQFPQDEKTLFDYDIVILGDVPRNYFSTVQLRNLRRFVEDKGSSLIVICGEKHMPYEYRNTPLESVFPVTIPSTPEPVITQEPFRWELTPAGQQDPLLRMDDDPTESRRIWTTLQGMYWCAGVTKAKPGATVLAVNPARSNGYGKRIVLAVQSYGSGRCLLSTTDGCWRWRWKVGDRYFYRYWGQAIRSMTPEEMPGGNRFAQVNADRGEYLLGERVVLHARLLDAFYRPIKDKQVNASLNGETGVSTSVLMNSIPGSPGLFSADFLADRIGKYRVSLGSPAQPGALANANFLVQSVALEKQQPEMNEDLLKKLAAGGGGGYYHPDEVKEWMKSLKVNEQVIKSESEIELWDAPFFLVMFIVPLALEWLIRKRSGLL